MIQTWGESNYYSDRDSSELESESCLVHVGGI